MRNLTKTITTYSSCDSTNDGWEMKGLVKRVKWVWECVEIKQVYIIGEVLMSYK
jgi:hypothetical protein